MMMPITLMMMLMIKIMWASFQASLSPFWPFPLPAEFDQMFGGVHGFVVVVDLQCCQCFVSTPVSTLKLKLIQGNQKSETHLNWRYWKARRWLFVVTLLRTGLHSSCCCCCCCGRNYSGRNYCSGRSCCGMNCCCGRDCCCGRSCCACLLELSERSGNNNAGSGMAPSVPAGEKWSVQRLQNIGAAHSPQITRIHSCCLPISDHLHCGRLVVWSKDNCRAADQKLCDDRLKTHVLSIWSII